MASVKRAYDSSRRKGNAAANRARIAESARRLIVRDGFAATTIEAIAADARVSVPTVYAVYGSKRAILLELLDAMERDAHWTEPQQMMVEAGSDPRAELGAIVAFTARFFTAGADMVRAVRSAGQADPEFDLLRREGERRRRQWLEPIVARWAAAGVIRDGLTQTEALDTIFTLVGDEIYRSFVTDAGWSVERYRTWLEDALARILFRV
jgi:AcrR family transcriptional regulator